MASSSDIPGDALTVAHEEPHGETASAALSDAPNGGEDFVPSDAPRAGEYIVPEPPRLPDICNLDWQREGMPDSEFNRKYPPDAWGEEAAPNARVWKIYRDQLTVSDRGMLDSWNKTLDVLLIFAGLFSAVSTAFLIESYKTLQPDYTQYVAVFLYAAAISHNRTGGAFPSLDTIVAPDRFVQTSATQRWTNGLWFSSLVISLGVALLCILIKQWLDEYNAHVSSAAPSPKYWARRHRMYYRGLETWGVPGLISFLPVLLHLSLFLFFGGLVLFLLPLDGTIAYSTLVLVSCILTFYGLSLILPARSVECPSHTPLFAQVLTTVSRGLSCILYLVRILVDRLCAAAYRPDGSTRPVIRALLTRAEHVASRLRSIGTGWHLLREKECISQWDEELDGHILSALINMPSDLTWGIVHTAYAAIGAFPSARTARIIHTVHGLYDKLEDSYEKIASRGTGFAITTHAQLRRAAWAIGVERNPRALVANLTPYDPGLRSSLGIDGLVLQAMGVDGAYGHSYDHAVLLRSLQSILVSGTQSHGFPLRSICLLFLDDCATLPTEPRDRSLFDVPPRDTPAFRSCTLLVLCAGRFTDAGQKQFMHGLRSVEILLRREFSITLPAHKGRARDLVCAVTNGLWMILANPEGYAIDTVTSQIVAKEAIEIYSRISHVPWAQLPGLSAFVRSPSFGRCVATRSSLDKYITPFYYPKLRKCTDVQVLQIWECNAALYKLDWDYVSRAEEALVFYSTTLFPVKAFDWYWMKKLCQRSPYETPDDWNEPALAAFLNGPNALATWTGATSLNLNDDYTLDVADLANRIAIVLCRRQRLGRANDTFIQGFFNGSFLFARFRDLVLRDIPDQSGHPSLEETVMALARHCLKLSPSGCLEICAQLEQLEVPDADAHEHAVSLAAYIRDGTRPGGALSEACPADCPCMIEHVRPARSFGDVCNDLVTQFWRGRPGSVTVEHV